ncbi:MAG: hypothetical protein QM765_44110 [Myxococcales bacterium]
MTTDDDKLDLSALDPTRDELRFERMVRSLAAKAVAQRPPDSLGLAVRFWRPALALAASLALLAWAPSLLTSSSSTVSSDGETTADPGTTLLSWASGEGPTSAADVLTTFGRTP